jgi:hypothetical protein
VVLEPTRVGKKPRFNRLRSQEERFSSITTQVKTWFDFANVNYYKVQAKLSLSQRTTPSISMVADFSQYRTRERPASSSGHFIPGKQLERMLKLLRNKSPSVVTERLLLTSRESHNTHQHDEVKQGVTMCRMTSNRKIQ